MLTELWARRLRDRGIVSGSRHASGWADAPGSSRAFLASGGSRAPRLRYSGAGADTIVWLAASEAGMRTTGRFWLDRRPRSTEYLPGMKVTPSEAERLLGGVRAT